MELQFQSNLDFQIEAVKSIVDLFETQEFLNHNQWNVGENGIIPNTLDMDSQVLLDNLKSIQRRHGLSEDQELREMNFSVEMETGTGKTYVYLRTIFELNKHYGFRKFMIIVPSVAIREGVLKSLLITKRHFQDIYANVPYRYYEYDSKKINHIRQFARGSFIEIMVITVDSFNKDTNIMNQERDGLQGQKPIELVQKTRPILILDEPQNMESDLSKTSLKSLNPLFTLRYSATHRDPYNLTYRLTPVDAARKNLVKKIEVSSITDSGDFNVPYVQCVDIKSTSNNIKAKAIVNKITDSGTAASTITIKSGDDLAHKTNNPQYDGYVVSEIDSRYNFIKFNNGITLKKGDIHGPDRRQIMEMQIRHAVELHFKKHEQLKPEGIKPLTLFFIDKVDNYLSESGFIRTAFKNAFNTIKTDYQDFRNVDVDSVHGGYFSNRSTEASIKKDKQTFDLIMKDKESLISFNTPMQFIFSHSALTEGWDNPNVFTICTLNPTASIMKKRQEIGRGMRLPINQRGDRITHGEHVLTIVANERYEEYAKKLQSEYEYGGNIAPPQPMNSSARTTLRLKHRFTRPEFKTLWAKVAKKTKYAVDINSTKLVQECIAEINTITIDKIKIQIQRVELNLEDKGVTTKFIGKSQPVKASSPHPVPDIVEHIAKETMLTRGTIVKIMMGINNLELVFKNPQEFVSSCTTIIKEKLADSLVNGIKYIQVDDYYRMSLFDDIDVYGSSVVSVDKTIYDSVACDSKVEEQFAKDLDGEDQIKLFVKLPRWFTVDTPIGQYNPDWAIVKNNADEFGVMQEAVYLVVETKGSLDSADLRPNEKRKIRCGLLHFQALGVKYGVYTNVSALLRDENVL